MVGGGQPLLLLMLQLSNRRSKSNSF